MIKTSSNVVSWSCLIEKDYCTLYRNGYRSPWSFRGSRGSRSLRYVSREPGCQLPLPELWAGTCRMLEVREELFLREKCFPPGDRLSSRRTMDCEVRQNFGQVVKVMLDIGKSIHQHQRLNFLRTMGTVDLGNASFAGRHTRLRGPTKIWPSGQSYVGHLQVNSSASMITLPMRKVNLSRQRFAVWDTGYRISLPARDKRSQLETMTRVGWIQE